MSRFFGAVFLSFYGDWLTTVALLVVLYRLTGNPAGPAGYMVARIAPRMVGPWLGGSLADRLSPRGVMVSAMSLQAVLTATLVFADRAQAVWAIYAAVAAAQFAGALGRPSQGALLPTLVRDENLGRANAMYSLFFGTSIFVGPAIGAVLLLRTGPDLLFVIDAATFAIGAVLAATLPGPGRRAAQPPGRRFLADLTSGFLPALREPVTRMVAAGNFATGLVISVTQAVLVLAAHDRFGGDTSVGYLYAAVGVGGTIGGLVALRWTPPRKVIRVAIIGGAIVEVFGLAGFGAVDVLPIALVLLGLSTLGGSGFDAWGNTEVQRRAPPEFRGRYNAAIFVSLYAGMLLGALWALGTASFLNWSDALRLACLAMLILLGVVWATARDRHPVRAVALFPPM